MAVSHAAIHIMMRAYSFKWSTNKHIVVSHVEVSTLITEGGGGAKQLVGWGCGYIIKVGLHLLVEYRQTQHQHTSHNTASCTNQDG